MTPEPLDFLTVDVAEAMVVVAATGNLNTTHIAAWLRARTRHP